MESNDSGSRDLTVVDASARAVEPGQWNREQVDIIKRLLAPGIDDGNLALFGMVCRRVGLDPFMRQIYAIQRAGKWTFQTGIDGYRQLAARTHALVGIDDAIYDTETDEHPNRATVTVWRLVQGQRYSFTATARWREYAVSGKDSRLTEKWASMPYLMLGKCAEALALRKAFPPELSGIYTEDEMGQADNPERERPQRQLAPAPAARNGTPMRTALVTREWAVQVEPATAAPVKSAPAKMNVRSWSTLRLRALEVGVSSDQDWETLVVSLTDKTDARRITIAEDYPKVEAYVADMERQQARIAATMTPADAVEVAE